LFRKVPVRVRPADPLLIGWIIDTPEDLVHKIKEGHGEARSFLIAQWDMAKDLAAAGLIQLTAGKE
jgi:hypothetical protein